MVYMFEQIFQWCHRESYLQLLSKIIESITNNILTHKYSECIEKINNFLIIHLFLISFIV